MVSGASAGHVEAAPLLALSMPIRVGVTVLTTRAPSGIPFKHNGADRQYIKASEILAWELP